MKIELTLPALERLIGGDTEIEVGLRKGIVLEFAKRHLVGVIDEQIETSLREFAQELINRAIKEELDIDNLATPSKYPHVSQRLRDLVRKCLDKELAQAIDGYVEKERIYTINRIHRVVEEQIKNYTKEEVARQASASLEEAIKSAFKSFGIPKG